jgi:hypothetical protein
MLMLLVKLLVQFSRVFLHAFMPFFRLLLNSLIFQAIASSLGQNLNRADKIFSQPNFLLVN